jgi:glucokinase
MSSGLDDSYPRLLGDIGGTNARFALITAPGEPVSHIMKLACTEHAGLTEAIQTYLAQIDSAQPRYAAIGVANPVSGDWLKLTNNPWAFSIEAVRQAVGLERLLFMNDFTALALSLPHLTTTDRQQVGSGTCVPGQAIGVIGPGTGLGVSGLVPTGAGTYVPLEGEGGHVSLCPTTDEEMAVTAWLTHEHGHVSAERVLSGPGLVTLYKTLGEVRRLPTQDLTSAEITQAGLRNSDTLCAAALAMFCALLGSVAGNLALTLGAHGGIFIGGGIAPRLLDYLAQSEFRPRFETKGRFTTYLKGIPTYVITAPYPALTGAAVGLDAALRHT